MKRGTVRPANDAPEAPFFPASAQPKMVMNTSPAFNLRLPRALQEELAKIAAQNHRSLNSEILVRLEQTLRGNWR